MQKYFISQEDFKNLRITGDDVHHIKNVMRGKIGDKIIVSDQESEAIVSICEIEKNYVSFKYEMAIQNNNELPFLIDLYQGYPKGDKLDDIIKHAVELGVNSIYGVITKRSVFKLDNNKLESKLARYNRIMKEASEQSNRKILSEFKNITVLKKIDFQAYDYKIVCYEESAKENEQSNFKNIIKKLKPNDKICIIIGPEGGLDLEEVTYLNNLGFISCGLGPRIMRCETASKYVLSAISYEWELK